MINLKKEFNVVVNAVKEQPLKYAAITAGFVVTVAVVAAGIHYKANMPKEVVKVVNVVEEVAEEVVKQ